MFRFLSLALSILLFNINCISAQDSLPKYTAVDIQQVYKLYTSGYRDVFIDDLNRKWFGSLNSGVLLFDGRDFKRTTIQQGVASNFIFRISTDSDKNIWLATYNGVTCLQKDGGIKTYLEGTSERNNFFTYVFEDHQHRIYAMGFKGLFLKRDTGWHKIDSVTRYLHAVKAEKDTTWFMGDDALYYTVAKSNKPVKLKETSTKRNYKLSIDSKGLLWVLALDGIGYFKGGQYISVYTDAGFLSIAEYDGVYFLGSNGAGLFTWNPVTKKIQQIEAIKETSVTGLASQANGLWVSGYGLYFLEKSVSTIDSSFINVKSGYTSVKYVSKSNFLSVNSKREVVYTQNNVDIYLCSLNTNPVDNLISAFTDNANLYFSTQDRLLKYNLSTHALTGIGIPTKRATYEYFKKGDTVYLGRDDGFFKITGDTVHKIEFPDKYKETSNVSGLTGWNNSIYIFKQGVGLFEYTNGEINRLNIPDAVLFHTVSSMTVVKSVLTGKVFLVMLHSNGINTCEITNAGKLENWSLKGQVSDLGIEKVFGDFLPGVNNSWYNGTNQTFRIHPENFQTVFPTLVYQVATPNDSLSVWAGWFSDLKKEFYFPSEQRNILFRWSLPSEYERDGYHLKWELYKGDKISEGINTDGIINHFFSSGGNYTLVYSLVDIHNHNTIKKIELKLKVGLYWYESLFGKVVIVLVFSLCLVLLTLFIVRRINESKLQVLRRDIEFGELRSKALQNLIAPHLLFNLFNNIQSRIISDKKEGALKVLSTLSDFIRNSLNFSKRDLVSLEEELEMVEQYVLLEVSRNNNSQFDFRIQNLDNLDLAAIEFPSMVLQPLVENAIKYGTEDNEIVIEIYKEAEALCVVVKNSKSLVSSNLVQGTGNGFSLVTDKLRLVEMKYKVTYQFTSGLYENGYRAEIRKIVKR